MPDTKPKLSVDFLSWLVEGRANNQQSTLKLYKIVSGAENRKPFENSPSLFMAAQELTAIGFSLWRAVFLNDLSHEFDKESANLQSFLENLIAHNSIQYMTDFNSREWSFWYYLKNATSRLGSFSSEVMDGIVNFDTDTREGPTARERWEDAQALFNSAVDRFRAAVEAKR